MLWPPTAKKGLYRQHTARLLVLLCFIAFALDRGRSIALHGEGHCAQPLPPWEQRLCSASPLSRLGCQELALRTNAQVVSMWCAHEPSGPFPSLTSALSNFIASTLKRGKKGKSFAARPPSPAQAAKSLR